MDLFLAQLQCMRNHFEGSSQLKSNKRCSAGWTPGPVSPAICSLNALIILANFSLISILFVLESHCNHIFLLDFFVAFNIF